MNTVFKFLMVAIAALTLAVVSAPAYAHGPQPLPAQACNDGTANAHQNIGAPAHSGAHDRVAHDHGAGCVHLNPTANH